MEFLVPCCLQGVGEGQDSKLGFLPCWEGRKGSGSYCSITYHASLLRVSLFAYLEQNLV